MDGSGVSDGFWADDQNGIPTHRSNTFFSNKQIHVRV